MHATWKKVNHKKKNENNKDKNTISEEKRNITEDSLNIKKYGIGNSIAMSIKQMESKRNLFLSKIINK